MSNSKLEIKIGELKFSGEGNEKWLSEQLDKLIEKLPEIVSNRPASKSIDVKSSPKRPVQKAEKKEPNAAASLSGFLREKSATSNQAKKFLATAVYLLKTGSERISTSDVSKALKDARQNKLTNASDCLNKEVKKGNCVKDGKQFYVTESGEESIG